MVPAKNLRANNNTSHLSLNRVIEEVTHVVNVLVSGGHMEFSTPDARRAATAVIRRFSV